MKRVNFHLEERQIEQLERRSEATGASVAWVIRRALDEYFSRPEAVPRKTRPKGDRR